MRRHSYSLFAWFGAVALLSMLAACAESHTGDSASSSAFLARAADCDDLLDKLQDDALAKVRFEADQVRAHPEWYYGGWGYPQPVPGGDVRDAGTAPPTGAPSSGNDSDSGGAESPRDPSGYSDTNTQVKGVDEADFVKTVNDGKNVYVLHGTKLLKLASWPAEATAIEETITLDFAPQEMFAWNGKIVLLGQWSEPVACDDKDLPRPLPAEDVGGAPASDVPYWCNYETGVQITLLDAAAEGAPVLRQIFLRGNYTTSRRHGDVVRVITQQYLNHPPAIPTLSGHMYANGTSPASTDDVVARVNDWEQAASAAIAQTTLSDWIPAVSERANGELVDASLACQNYYVPTPGLTGYGITTVLAIDMSSPTSELGGAMILGNAQAVYSNTGALVLAQPDWTYGMGIEKDRTLIHRFDLGSEVETRYVGSAFVRGVVKDQFSMDERDGVVRVATTQNRWGGGWGIGVPVDPALPPTSDGDGVAVDGGTTEPEPMDAGAAEPTEDGGAAGDGDPGAMAMALEEPTRLNYVTTLGATSEGFGILGETAGLAPEEMIFSARFVGNFAYVVTFRQVDPLFVIDLSNPAEPTVLGELKIPGFSDYIHPLDDGHLLTIGRDATDEGWVQGVALQIFDVRNPGDPQLAHKYTFDTDGWSEANGNHKAFTFWADKGLLAIPFMRWGASFSSTLEVFEVDAANGFTHKASIDHSPLIAGSVCQEPYYDYASSCSYSPEVRRGFFIDDYVYSYSYGGVLVHSLEDLTSAVASVPFPSPY